MSHYYHKPYRAFGENVKVELDLYSYATTADLKNAKGTDTSYLVQLLKF